MADEPNGHKNNGARPHSGLGLFATIPLWFIAIAGLIYATGFLTVLSFHESYHLRGLDGGFFKVKYVHVGIMFTLIPLIFGTAVFAVANYCHHKGDNENPLNPLSIATGALVMLAVCLVVLFVPYGTPYKELWPLGCIIATALIGWGLVTYWDELSKCKIPLMNKIVPRHHIVYCIAIIVLVVLHYFLIEKFFNTWREMFFFSGLLYSVLSMFMGWIVWQLVDGRKETKIAKCVEVVLLGLVYYLTVLCFGLGVYTYIPAGNGGGDFTTANFVVLKLKSEPPESSKHKECSKQKESLPAWLTEHQPDPKLIRLELIESGSDSIFVANPWQKIPRKGDAKTGPRLWRKGREYRPKVLEIPRDQILSTQHLDESYESYESLRKSRSPKDPARR